MKSIGIIGMGNMGFAIARGIKDTYANLQLNVIDKDKTLAEERANEIGASEISSFEQLVKNSEIVIIAVKPQHLDELFKEISSFTKDKKIITIAAGKKISYFEDNLYTGNVVRFMPNIAAKESLSLTGIAFGENVSEAFKKEAVETAESFGTCVILPETLMPAITGLSGSGIAYVFAFIHALALGGTSSGIPYDTSLDITVQTIEGALALVKESGTNPVTSLTRVISAGGTTIAGIKALESRSFTAAVMEAVEKAAQKAKEFEN